MKRLNRKGFTLVELLAVIIILAIVVGITIPAILTTTSKAREKAFQTSVESFANWLNRQYEAKNLGNELLMKVDPIFARECKVTFDDAECQISSDLLEAGGLKPGNYDLTKNKPENDGEIQTIKEYNEIKFKNGKFCVKLIGNPSGDYSTDKVKYSDDDCSGRDEVQMPSKKVTTNQAKKRVIIDEGN